MRGKNHRLCTMRRRETGEDSEETSGGKEINLVSIVLTGRGEVEMEEESTTAS